MLSLNISMEKRWEVGPRGRCWVTGVGLAVVWVVREISLYGDWFSYHGREAAVIKPLL
jgi:hypothetical protein